MWLPVGIIDQSLGSACFPVCKILAHFESEVSHGIIHVHSRLKCYSNTWAQAAIYCHHITAKGSVRIGWLTGTKYDNMKAILIQILFFHEQVHQARLLQKKKKKKLINWKKKRKSHLLAVFSAAARTKKKHSGWALSETINSACLLNPTSHASKFSERKGCTPAWTSHSIYALFFFKWYGAV